MVRRRICLSDGTGVGSIGPYLSGWKAAGIRIINHKPSRKAGGKGSCTKKENQVEFVDIVWMGFIIAGALSLLYRSLWKKKGHCTGCCNSGVCGKNDEPAG